MTTHCTRCGKELTRGGMHTCTQVVAWRSVEEIARECCFSSINEKTATPREITRVHGLVLKALQAERDKVMELQTQLEQANKELEVLKHRIETLSASLKPALDIEKLPSELVTELEQIKRQLSEERKYSSLNLHAVVAVKKENNLLKQSQQNLVAALKEAFSSYIWTSHESAVVEGVRKILASFETEKQ